MTLILSSFYPKNSISDSMKITLKSIFALFIMAVFGGRILR